MHAICRAAFRRPLAADQQGYIDRQFEEAPDRLSAVKRVVLLVLKSPRFLYREVGGGPADQFDTASRISFGLWDSLPDRTLSKRPPRGKLASRDQIVAQLERMLPDLRTRSKLREFFLGWLKISQPRDLSKDPKAFPEFTPDVISDLRTSIELSLDDMLDSGSADFRQFLLSDDVYLNGRLAKIYGAKLPDERPVPKSRLRAEPSRPVCCRIRICWPASRTQARARRSIAACSFRAACWAACCVRPRKSVAPLPPEFTPS